MIWSCRKEKVPVIPRGIAAGSFLSHAYPKENEECAHAHRILNRSRCTTMNKLQLTIMAHDRAMPITNESNHQLSVLLSPHVSETTEKTQSDDFFFVNKNGKIVRNNAFLFS